MPEFLLYYPFFFSLLGAAIAGASAFLIRRAALTLGGRLWWVSWAAAAGSSAGFAWSFSWAWGLESKGVSGSQVLLVVLGWAAVLAGIAVGLWGLSALGMRALLPRPTDRLETGPPYRYLRRPMALGGALAGLGASLIVETPSAWLCFLTWLILANLLQELEDWELRGRIPAARDYQARTPRYLARRRNRLSPGKRTPAAG
jgi:protein-S-isoprenylcysteine O-methyltransferase Ste14